MIRFTLHDFFGYLLPGSVLLAAITVLAWPIVPAKLVAQENWNAWTPMTLTCMVLVVFLAYFAGHIAVWLSAVVLRLQVLDLSKKAKKATESEKAISEMGEIAKRKAGIILGLDSDKASEMSEYLLDRTCDALILEHGSESSRELREIFLYRLEFYRASALSFAALALVLVLRAIFDATFDAYGLNLLFLVLSALAAVACYFRYGYMAEIRKVLLWTATFVLPIGDNVEKTQAAAGDQSHNSSRSGGTNGAA